VGTIQSFAPVRLRLLQTLRPEFPLTAPHSLPALLHLRIEHPTINPGDQQDS
jgi:hypothetical protein